MMLREVANNPFRILGLTASANYDDIVVTSRKVRSANKFRKTHERMWGGDERLGPIKCSNPLVNAAVTRLDDPVQRVWARLLWYHSDPRVYIAGLLRHSNEDHDAVLAHDLSLNAVLSAAQQDPKFYSLTVWQNAVQMWVSSISSPSFWQYIVELEQKSHFNKSVFESEINGLRENPPYLPLQIWLFSAKQYLDALDMDGFVRVNHIATNSPLEEHWNKAVQDELVKPMEQQLENSAQQVDEILTGVDRKLSQDYGSLKGNKSIVDQAATIISLTMKPTVICLRNIPQVEKGISRWSENLLAKCLLDVSNSYIWANEWDSCDDLLNEAASWVEPQSALELRISRRKEERGI